MLLKNRIALFSAVLFFISSESVLSACGATVNGRPMTDQECAVATQVYGYVIPGDYWADGNGNWVNANNPMHRGNTYRDAQSSRDGSWSGRSTNAIYDSSGGCEGGGCVNIID